jgi:hypothetical protein
MTKKIINIFFLLIFLMQVLPVKQVGRSLFNASMIEELPEKAPEKSKGCEDDTKHFLSHDNHISFLFTDPIQFSYIHHSETLPVLMPCDVQSPPPDFL